MLDKVTVDYYGTPTQINQMAAVSVPEARLMVIQPWDISTLSAIQKAILGLLFHSDTSCLSFQLDFLL